MKVDDILVLVDMSCFYLLRFESLYSIHLQGYTNFTNSFGIYQNYR